MAYIELKIADIACIIYQKRNLLTQIFINLLLIVAKLFPQSPQFAFNILRFGEEPEKLTIILLSQIINTLLSFYTSSITSAYPFPFLSSRTPTQDIVRPSSLKATRTRTVMMISPHHHQEREEHEEEHQARHGCQLVDCCHLSS